MKKIFLVLITCFIITGCNKQLKCSTTTENDIVKISHTYKIKYNGDDIMSVDNIISYNVKGDALMENFRALLKFTMDDYETSDIKYDYEENGNLLSLSTKYEIKSLSEEEINNVLGTKVLSEYKSKLESEGFKCK